MLSEAVHLAAVTDGEDETRQYPVIYLVDDAVVSSAYAPLTVPSDEFFDNCRARLLGKQFNDSLNPALRMAIQLP